MAVVINIVSNKMNSILFFKIPFKCRSIINIKYDDYGPTYKYMLTLINLGKHNKNKKNILNSIIRINIYISEFRLEDFDSFDE